ncbi:two-component system histidine kinase PnpS [Aquibacillus kalidii]|uniref:two-component system histidine kinase PnpS n=1 Tax=Aquibacillus kalidii TaxID=2762597 RepID=UPI001644BBD2|nr:HAMP domain-containing sensor histidine kinase [Aquibacillus kalidii]
MGSKKSSFLLIYIAIILSVFILIGFVLSPMVEGNEQIVVILCLVGGLTTFFILLHNLYINYIKPVRSVSMVARELVKGNYKARTYVNNYGEAGQLSNSINVLARSLQEMNVHEKMQGSQLKTVIDNMESGLMLIDEKGYVHLINRKFLNMFGQEAKDYIGYLYYEVLEQENIHKAVQEAFLYEEKVKDSFTISMKVEKRFVEIVGAPIFNESNDLKGAVLVFHDITELKRLEQMRKDFVANVSHELKTPITSIRGFAETLLDGAMDEEKLRNQFLSIILSESERLQALVYDLLELSKLEKEELRLRTEVVDIKELLEGLLPITKQQASKKEITFKASLGDEIKLVGDQGRLKQVFINLINNAINYTPNNGQVDLKVNSTANTVKIIVSDTGIGIPEEFQSRIFERFYRVDRARSRNTGGTGLGLAIVKHIIEAHKGSIEIKSELDKGSSFIVTLPKNSM